MNILLVGTSLVTSEALQRFMEGLRGWGFITCSSGQASLDVTMSFTPDIAVIDDHLPDMDNLMLLKHLKGQAEDAYFLLLMDRNDHRRLEQALASGIDDYILTPVEDVEMIARLRKAIYQKENSSASTRLTEVRRQAAAGSRGEVEQIYNRAGAASAPPATYDTAQYPRYEEPSRSEEKSRVPDVPAPKKKLVVVKFPTQSPLTPEKAQPVVEEPEIAKKRVEFREPVNAEHEPPPVASAPQRVPQETTAPVAAAEAAVPAEPAETALRVSDFLTRKSSRAKSRSKKKRKQQSPLRSTAKAVGNIVFIGMLVLMASLAFFLVQSKLAGGAPSVAGYQMYVVLSGSMNPAFDTGSLIFVRPQDPNQLEAGDIITFSGSGGGRVMTTHRIVEVQTENSLQFVTRGDANNVNDPNPVPAANVVGKVHGAIPYLGYILGFAQTRNGLIALVFIPGILVIIFELRNIFRYAAEMEREKLDKARREGSAAPSAGA